MEKKGGWSQKQSLINELAQGRELARQLHIYLNAASSSSSQESLDLLLQKIQHSLQKALLILSCNGASLGNILSPSESPLSLNASPTSDKGADPHASRKIRNSLPCWTEKVTVNPDMLLEGPPDDNFSWRKYGQKDILGAKFPRGYYRCTQRNVSGCPATKLVQRSDDDPNMLEITYRGNHTCTHNNINPPSLAPLPQINPPSVLDDYDYLINQHRLPQFEYPTMTSKPSLNVITENLDTTLDHHNQSFPSISFDNFASINELDHVIIPAYTVNFPEDHLFGPPDHSFIFPSGLLQNGLNDGNPDLAPTSSGMSPFSRVEPDPEFTFGNQGKFS